MPPVAAVPDRSARSPRHDGRRRRGLRIGRPFGTKGIALIDQRRAERNSMIAATSDPPMPAS